MVGHTGPASPAGAPPPKHGADHPWPDKKGPGAARGGGGLRGLSYLAIDGRPNPGGAPYMLASRVWLRMKGGE